MKKLKLGLVGCGAMMGTHVKGVLQVENVEIVAVCDIVEENAKAVADALGGTPKIFTEYCDMVECGIIDPTKVTRSALENAASVASVFLTTESVIADEKEPAAPQMPAGGMGGMY